MGKPNICWEPRLAKQIRAQVQTMKDVYSKLEKLQGELAVTRSAEYHGKHQYAQASKHNYSGGLSGSRIFEFMVFQGLISNV